jgi:CBS domain-containing protein
MMVDAALDSLITYNPWTLTPATTLAEAARILDETSIGQWPIVTDEGELAGTITAREVSLALIKDPAGKLSVATFAKAVKPIELGACPRQTLDFMLEQRLRMLPVVDGGRVVGTLSTSDYLRELSSAGGRIARELLIEYLERSVESIDADATLDEAQAAFANTNCLVVEQGDFPLGAITPVQIAFAQVQQFARTQRGASCARRTLGQLLQATPTIVPGRTLAEAATLLVDHNLDALAVVSQSGQLAGVLLEERILQVL